MVQSYRKLQDLHRAGNPRTARYDRRRISFCLNIVREKEIGTIEQINVTPISKLQFVLGKLIPFWILANIVFTIGLILGYLIYHITPQGSLLVLYTFVSAYLLAILGFGLLISTFCQTQQQAMFFMFFFMIIFILLGGLFTPIESMPGWAQWITKFNPVAYMIQVMRMVILKGSGFRDILPQLGAISLIAVVLNSLAVWNYRKTS
jgi:ABC-2 type transport system permease protein